MKFNKYECLPNLEVSEIIDWNKRYDEIVTPQGCRLIKSWELLCLLESSESERFLGKYANISNIFFCSPSDYAKIEKYCEIIMFEGMEFFYVFYGSIDKIYDDGRVVFVRDVRK